MIEAILKGERRAGELVALCDPQIRKKKDAALRAALEGNWKRGHLFALRQAYEGWQFYQKQIAECDQQIGEIPKELAGPEDPQASPPPAGNKRGGGNTPQIAGLHSLLYRLCGGKDATTLPGVADHVLLELIGELGTDLQKHWPGEKQFTAYLGLATGQPAKWQAAGQPETVAQPGGQIVLPDRALGGAERGQGVGWILPAFEKPAWRAGGQFGIGAQILSPTSARCGLIRVGP